MIGSHFFWVDILLSCGYASIFIITSCFIGTMLLNIDSRTPARKAFYNTVAGALLIISLYSCVVTGFRTINTCTLAVLIYLGFFNKSFFNYKAFSIKELMPFLYILPVIFVLCGIYIFPVSMQTDVKFYSKIITNFPKQGIENIYHYYNNYNAGFRGMTPYHYTEFWFASFFSVTTKSLSVFSLRYFAYPLLISLAGYGILAITDKNKFLVFCLFVGATVFSLGGLISIINTGWDIQTSFWLRPNFITYYLIFVLMYNTILDENPKLMYAFLSIGMTFSFVITVLIFISMCVVNAVKWLSKEYTFKQVLMNMACPFLVFVSLFAFYRFFGPALNLTVEFSLGELIKNSLGIYKAVIGTSFILIAEASLVPLVFWFVSRRYSQSKEENSILIFIFTLIIVGVLMFQFLVKLDNAYQFANFAYVGVGFLFLLLLIRAMNLITRPAFKIVIAVALCFSFFYSHPGVFRPQIMLQSFEKANIDAEEASDEWTAGVKQYLMEHPNAKGAFLFSSQNLMNYPSKARHCLTIQVGSHISFLTDNSNLPCITCKDTLLYDYNESRKDEFVKQLQWIESFPNYTTECDPEKYLSSGKFDYFICHLDYPIKDKSLKIIPDTRKKLKLVYIN